MDECLFCKIVNDEISSEIIFENENVLAFRDLNPQAPTHILVYQENIFPLSMN